VLLRAVLVLLLAVLVLLLVPLHVEPALERPTFYSYTKNIRAET
jgi:hypothetical protein